MRGYRAAHLPWKTGAPTIPDAKEISLAYG